MRSLILLAIAASSLAAQGTAPPMGKQGDYIAKNFRFSTGDVLPEVKIHYTTLGAPRKDARGITRNAVLVGHGTGGSGGGTFIRSRGWTGELYGPGQPLDTTKYFIVLPDNLGHGASSKPSDGLKAKFPKYTYDDMVKLQYQLLTEGLGVNHLRLVMGTSMGCMHSWVFLYTYPDFMDGALPLACAPTPIVGRNRAIRTMIMDALRNDPNYMNGEYTGPLEGMKAAQGFLWVMGTAPLNNHRQSPTREAADSAIRRTVAAATTDPNNMIWYFDASRDYDPSKHLDKIKAPILHINSADDFVNPPELNNVEPYTAKLKNAKFVLLPITDQTRGHGTHSLPAIWGGMLRDFLSTLPER
jgi:homoserine O-acetyltransferase